MENNNTTTVTTGNANRIQKIFKAGKQNGYVINSCIDHLLNQEELLREIEIKERELAELKRRLEIERMFEIH